VRSLNALIKLIVSLPNRRNEFRWRRLRKEHVLFCLSLCAAVLSSSRALQGLRSIYVDRRHDCRRFYHARGWAQRSRQSSRGYNVRFYPDPSVLQVSRSPWRKRCTATLTTATLKHSHRLQLSYQHADLELTQKHNNPLSSSAVLGIG
jgi:hypothetical protein